jgi:signal transduction histidine kinase
MLKAERERIDALKRSIEIKDEFLSIISHEFKTPLAVIFSAIQTMEHTCGSELTERARGFISKIRQNSLRQLRLVNNLLDITRINSGELGLNWNDIDIVPLTRAITRSVEDYAKQKNISLEFNSRIKQKIIALDQEKYERILLNLLSNAIKFTPEGKSIIVGVSMKNRYGSRMICIEVRDEGMGIPSEKMECIFDRFVQVDSSFTRQAEGVGIGLYLAKKFTEFLGGTMTAKSRVGQGSCFSVFLPDKRNTELSQPGTESMKDDNKLLLTARVEFSDMDPIP